MENHRNFRRPLALLLLLVFITPILLGALGDKTFDGDVTLNGLTLNATRDYYLTQMGDYALAFQSQATGWTSELSLFANDGDASDNVLFRAFATGIPTDIIPQESLIMGYRTGIGYVIASSNLAPGVDYPITIDAFASGANPQLVCNTDGTVSLNAGFSGDVEFDGDVKLTTVGKGIKLTGTEGEIWIYPCTNPVTLDRGIKIPILAYGSAHFMTVNDDGIINFINSSTVGDIDSVWSDVADDVSGLVAAAGDTLDATSADSTVPWQVDTTAAPTVEGRAIWDSDDDRLAVGDGTNTLTMISVQGSLPTSASDTGVAGHVAFDSKYMYRAVATNTWKRVELATWTDSALLLPTGDVILLPTGDYLLLSE